MTYVNDGERFALDAGKLQLCTKDRSKVASAEKTKESKESANCTRINIDGGANRIDDNCLDCLSLGAIQEQLCSGVNSKLLLTENAKESGESLNGGGVDGPGNNYAKDLACSSKFKYENLPAENIPDEQEIAMEEKTRAHYDQSIGQNTAFLESRDEDLSAKDLLCFAWQIARGMVSGIVSGELHAFFHQLMHVTRKL